MHIRAKYILQQTVSRVGGRWCKERTDDVGETAFLSKRGPGVLLSKDAGFFLHGKYTALGRWEGGQSICTVLGESIVDSLPSIYMITVHTTLPVVNEAREHYL